MFAKWLPALLVGVSAVAVGCGSSGPDSGAGGTDGAGTGGASSGVGTGGTSASGGAASGGQSSGGASSGGGANSGGSGGGGAVGDADPSAGCSVPNGLETITQGGASVSGGLATSTRLSIDIDGDSRDYIIDIPEDYDPTHPYRVIFSWHQAYGSANGNAVGQIPVGTPGVNFDAENYAFFGLHRESMAAGDPVIFVAPQGIGNLPWNYDRDVVLFDDVLAHVAANLCIDEWRVFTTGFSFGAMMSHALSLGRASKLRGAVTMAPANYNFTQPTNEPATLAYFGITGMSDDTCKWVNSDANETGGKYCVLTHAEDNGCTASTNFPTAAGGSNDHVCYDFEGCDAGYPVKVCTFDGGHTPSSINDGETKAEDGLNAFIPPLAWDFISSL